MKVIRAKVLGFCMGVRRAVELACIESERPGRGSIYTLGPLIHNPEVLAELKKHGVEIIDELPQNLKDISIIIRAHGISPDAEKDLIHSGCRVIDATCPRVKTSQIKAEELTRAGYFLFLAGEAKHAEITGILGYAKAGRENCCVVAGNAVEAGKEALKLYNTSKNAKTALIGQTTFREEEYLAIGAAIKKYFPSLEIVRTICAAATDRRQALRELLDHVDAVVIAGGKESANTRRLLAIVQERDKPCVLVENAREIPTSFRSYKTVGISAGASTPDSVVDEIERELLR
ncbi:MAG: 4-hydroxy-3-methylbut-2-enyl diphosphate reductase [Treponema sp.]|jgi:4-hydroxy-3-methylbut-2-enyl diphosphate reductase|nr:4-hydroxy-3-methylbut-2-enyl diphosphate reductase [Treponema sp.]